MTGDRVVITVAGEMSDALRAEFDDFDVHCTRGVTRFRVRADPAAVHGMIHRLRSFGLELLDVRRAPATPDSDTRSPPRW